MTITREKQTLDTENKPEVTSRGRKVVGEAREGKGIRGTKLLGMKEIKDPRM